jgi:hypothetical protein
MRESNYSLLGTRDVRTFATSIASRPRSSYDTNDFVVRKRSRVSDAPRNRESGAGDVARDANVSNRAHWREPNKHGAITLQARQYHVAQVK